LREHGLRHGARTGKQQADGDGVIVVPCAKAKAVAEYAQTVIKGDETGRRSLYEKLGLRADDSVK
jgi:regulator of RNase E activity RraA